MRKATEPTWRDSTGKVWRMSEMGDIHLARTIAMLERVIPKGAAYVRTLSMFSGGSEPEALEGLEARHRFALSDAKAKLAQLKAEAVRRKPKDTPNG